MVMRSFILSLCKDFKIGETCGVSGALTTARTRKFWTQKTVLIENLEDCNKVSYSSQV